MFCIAGREARLIHEIDTSGERAYITEHGWGDDYSLDCPQWVSVDATGRVYATADETCHVFSPEGEFLYCQGAISECCGMVADSNGSVILLSNMDTSAFSSVFSVICESQAAWRCIRSRMHF